MQEAATGKVQGAGADTASTLTGPEPGAPPGPAPDLGPPLDAGHRKLAATYRGLPIPDLRFMLPQHLRPQ